MLANEREEAAVLRARGLSGRADDIERVCDRVAEALGQYMRWLPESEAALWSGHTTRWLRARFEGYRQQGDARREGRRRYYRASALPRSVDVAGLRQMARSDAEAAA